MLTEEVLQRGIADGTHIGAQMYVSRDREVLADYAVGEARPGVPMTTDSLMIWFSMTKAVTAVAVAQQWERGNLSVDERVVHYIPEFGAHGKDVITLRHLLTHTAGIPNADGILQAKPWSESNGENLARIYDAPLEYEPGTRAGYHPGAGMAVLGEVVARVSGSTYSDYVHREIFEPLAMHDCWVGMPEERYAAYGDRIGLMHNTEGDDPTGLAWLDTPKVAAIPIPGGGGRGPMKQFGRLYEALLFGGLLAPPTVAAVSARHRTEMLDETFGIVLDWGLGFAIDTFAMGRYCSRRTFGHGGHQSSVAFCDPDNGVVVAYVCNGMPGRERHNVRLDAVSSAAYADLGIAKDGDAGRAKPFPTQGL